MSKPATKSATKQDLDQAMTTLRGEMSATETRLRSDMSQMKDLLRGQLRSDIAQIETGMVFSMGRMEDKLRADMKADMKAMEERLFEKFKESAQRIANTVSESHRKEVAAVDEKYKDLPGKHAELRAGFDGHVADLRLHPQPPTISAKRLRRPRSR